MNNGLHSLSIKLLVCPSTTALNNISLNNYSSLLVLFILEKMKRRQYNLLGLGIKLIKIVNVNNNI